VVIVDEARVGEEATPQLADGAEPENGLGRQVEEDLH
jgi:hypothetical protein